MLRLTATASQAASTRAAANLAAAGVVAGDRVAVAVGATSAPTDPAAVNQARILSLVLGALRSGVIPVMVNPDLPAAEINRQLAETRPALSIQSESQLAAIVDEPTAKAVELADVPLGRPMHFTSGTTGASKGVWTGVLAEPAAASLWGEEQEQWPFEPGDLSLVHGPLAHSGPLRFAMLSLLAGGDVLLPGKFDAYYCAQALAKQRPTVAFVVPSHLQRIFTLDGGAPPSPYRMLVHAGAACPEPLKRKIHAWAGVDRVWEFYGSTEGQFTACSGPEWEERPGSVGRARHRRQLTIDAGVIWCQTPEYAAFEYWGDPIKTASVWREARSTTAAAADRNADGRTRHGGHGPDDPRQGAGGREFTVGDLGRIDDAGYLYLDGRREDLIITGGVNVYPAQVEAVLLAHPGVCEAAVFGADDERWGQSVCAAVTGDADPITLTRWARQRLAPYQRPKQIFVVDDLPRTASGKIKRTQLAGMLMR